MTNLTAEQMENIRKTPFILVNLGSRCVLYPHRASQREVPVFVEPYGIENERNGLEFQHWYIEELHGSGCVITNWQSGLQLGGWDEKTGSIKQMRVGSHNWVFSHAEKGGYEIWNSASMEERGRRPYPNGERVEGTFLSQNGPYGQKLSVDMRVPDVEQFFRWEVLPVGSSDAKTFDEAESQILEGDSAVAVLAGLGRLAQFATEVVLLKQDSSGAASTGGKFLDRLTHASLVAGVVFDLVSVIVEVASIEAEATVDPLEEMYERLVEEMERIVNSAIEESDMRHALGKAAAGRIHYKNANWTIQRTMSEKGYADRAEKELSPEDLRSLFAEAQLDHVMTDFEKAADLLDEALGLLSELGEAGLTQFLIIYQEKLNIQLMRSLLFPEKFAYAYEADLNTMVELYESKFEELVQTRLAYIENKVDTYYRWNEEYAVSDARYEKHIRNKMDILTGRQSETFADYKRIRDELAGAG